MNAAVREPAEPRIVSFPGGELTLRGYLHRPPGAGPFPAVIWNHGAEKDPGIRETLGAFYTSAGYVLFIPHRHGHGLSPGEYDLDAIRARARREASDEEGYRRRAVELLIETLEAYLEDTAAAVSWLSRQALVDPSRMAMSGVSHGGIQVVLAAEVDLGMRLYVPFAPAATAWEGNPEIQSRLLGAVSSASEPIFLLQTANDYSLGPSEVLGEELRRKGEPNAARVYPAYGPNEQSGHGAFACEGTDVWGADVLARLERALQPLAATP